MYSQNTKHMTQKPVMTKTKINGGFTYSLGDKVFKKKSKVDYSFCSICFDKARGEWGVFGFSKTFDGANLQTLKYNSWSSFDQVQTVEIVSK